MSCRRVAEQIDPAHAAECLACTRVLAEHRALQAQLAQLPVPVLDRERRQALAAEVMARADLHDDTRASPRWRFGRSLAGVLAAAALLVVLVREERGLGTGVERRTLAVRAPVDPPHEAAPHVGERGVDVRGVAPSDDVVAKDPTVAPGIEPPVAPAVREPRTGSPSRSVFGSTTAKHDQAIARDTLVEQTPVMAFRAGWEALREARYADAIAAFDRATDPAVAEDAAFWAAIAAQRAGQADDARKRLDLFLATFPDSPRADSARRAREVLR